MKIELTYSRTDFSIYTQTKISSAINGKPHLSRVYTDSYIYHLDIIS